MPAVDVYERNEPMSGPLKTYDVSGLDVLGNGKPAPSDTVLRLKRAEAERLGLEKPAKKADDQSAPAPEAKPRTATGKPRKAAGTRKRSAPAKPQAE
jgi:hypothetical protein